MIDFRDEILVSQSFLSYFSVSWGRLQASPKDIEDLAEAGRIANTCPYFGSRKAIPQAQVILSHSSRFLWLIDPAL